MGIPVSLLDQSRIPDLDLSAYNCLILPGGSYKSWKDPEIEKIKKWVKDGGILIAVRDAVKWAIATELIDEELVEEEKETLNLPYAELSKARRAQRLSGAIFETQLDNTHPLAFGFRGSEDLGEGMAIEVVTLWVADACSGEEGGVVVDSMDHGITVTSCWDGAGAAGDEWDTDATLVECSLGSA